jgi:hypothetical protein
MPHGDLSDFVGIGNLAFGILALAAPQFAHQSFSLGPFTLTPLLEGEATAASAAILSVFASCLLTFGLALYIVRWNTINAKFVAVGFLTIAGMSFKNATWDFASKSFSPWLFLFFIELIAALHLIFNPNDAWTSETLRAHEEKKAAKKAAKEKKEHSL